MAREFKSEGKECVAVVLDSESRGFIMHGMAMELKWYP
jgi:hypothetical protein